METEFDFEDRIMSNEYDPNEDGQEISLRPKTLDEYVGQDKAKENLKVYIESAKMRGTALDHGELDAKTVGKIMKYREKLKL